MSRGREIAFGACAAVLFGGAIVAALDWERATATFPMVIGGAGLALAVAAVVRDVVARRCDGEAGPDSLSDDDTARARASFLWIGVFFGAVLLVGFEWGVGLAALAFYRFEARLGWIVATLSAVACGAFLYIAAHFLNIPLYAGWLVDLLP